MTPPQPSGEPSALPEGSVLLHVGPQKTGSTTIQKALHQNRAVLAEHRVHYVGRHAVEREAGRIALGFGSSVTQPPPRPAAWRRLVDEMSGSTQARLCLSNEDFGRADDAAVDRILQATGTERTFLVYVARRLDLVLPSWWQQQVKARLTASYADFLREMLATGPRAGIASTVMDPQDVGAVLDRWGKRLPPEQLIVVVADEDDRTALPRAFESLLALPSGTLEAPRGRNQSMSLAETEAVRRINQLADDEDWEPIEYPYLVQLGVVKALKARESRDARVTGVPDWAFERVTELADEQIAAIRSSGATVVGDPERLRVRDLAAPAPLPPEITAVDLDVFADVVSGVRKGSARMARARTAPEAASARLEDIGGRQLLRLLLRRVSLRLRRGAGRPGSARP